MSSKSEVSYGARIGNAEKLVAALQNFTDYQPVKPEYAISAYADLIANIKSQNNTVAAKKQAYSLAVDSRKNIYEISPNSINKILSPVNSEVKVIFGRTAKEAINVAGIIAKIRGANIKKLKSTNPKEETVSQSYQSFNAKAQYFSDLIVNLTSFGGNYTPANANLKIVSLTTLYNNAISANSLVMDTFTQFAQNNSSRIVGYEQLSQTAIRIKDSIKSQYGFNSTEYNLIKSLKI